MSHIQMPPQTVVEACNSYIEARKTRIQRECEELIASSVGYRGWFGFGKPMTREQAEAEWAEEIDLIKITGGMWANRVRELLSLATVAEKTNTLVTLDADIAHVLRSHFG